jgi:hypothetical protein
MKSILPADGAGARAGWPLMLRQRKVQKLERCVYPIRHDSRQISAA